MVRRAQIGVLIFSMAFASTGTVAAATNEVLTNAVDVLSLSPTQAARKIPVLITGVVTLAVPNRGGLFFVQDSTAGIFVNNKGASPILGDVVQISGISHAGGYAPDIRLPKWKKLGTAPLPEAMRISGERLASGADDGQRVEVSGIVRRARPTDKTELQLEVTAGDIHFQAFAPIGSNVDVNSLVGAMVRLRGTASALFNQTNRHLVSVSLWVPRGDDFIIDQLPGAAFLQAPFTPLGDIARYRRQSPAEERIRVKGIVTYQRPGEDIFLQEKIAGLGKSDGLQVSYRETNVFAPGEIVEAIGFPVIERTLPVLQDAVLKRTGEREETMVDRSATLPGIFKGFNHANLIALKGRLLDRSLRSLGTTSSSSSELGEHVLTLQSSNFLFSVTAPATPQFAGLSSIPIGSTLEVSGICLLQANHAGAVEAVQLLLPDSTSVRILQRPSWWTAQRLLAGIGILLTMSLLGISLTMTILRKNFALKVSIAEQAELTQELRRRAAYLTEAQRLSHTGSFGWKYGAMDELTWSEETYRIYGFDTSIKPSHELVRDRVHPDDLQVWQQAFDRAAEGKKVDFENRLVMPDGMVKFVHTVAYGVQKDGNFVELVGTVRDITERKRAEDAIRRSEAYLVETQKVSHTGSWAWSPEAGIKYWSEESYRVQGFDPRDGLPSTEQFFQRIHPDDQPGMMELMQRLSREKVAIETNFRIVHPGGAVRDIHSTCHPVFNLLGDFIEFIGTMFDVTERLRAEEQLRASERKYRHLVDTTPALVHTALPNGDLDFFNRGWLEYLGLPIADLLGWRWTSAIHSEDIEEFVAKWRAALASGRAFVAEARVRRADGKYRWFLHRKQPQRNETGEIVKWYGSSIEIEERKIAEEAIRRSEAYLAEAQKLSQTGSFAWSPEAGIKYWSDECYRVQGFDPRDGLPGFEELFQRVHPDDQSKWIELMQKVVPEKIEFETDYRLVLPDGAIRDIHCIGHPVLGPSDDLIEYIGTVIDITERKRSEETIRRSEAFLAEGQRLSHMGSWGWNAFTGKLTWSQEHFRILGLDPQDTTPSLDVFWERVHPDDRTALRRNFESAIRDKNDLEQEFRIVRPDSSIRHLHGVGHAVLNEANEFVEFIGSTMDITEHKRAEERAQSQREAIELALNAFVEELDVNRFLRDVISEITRRFLPKSWELWLFDEALGELSLQLSSHSADSRDREARYRNIRHPEELADVWRIKYIARAPQVFDLPIKGSTPAPQHFELLHAEGVKTVVLVPLVIGEQNLGFLELHFRSSGKFTSDDLELTHALVNHATLALQLNRLTRRAEQLAVTEERNRLAREIHDTLAQAFAGIVLHSEALGSSLGVSKRRSAMALSRIQKLARSGLDEARRSVQALRPKALEESTLSEALKQAAKRTNQTGTHTCHFRQRGETRVLSLEAQNELFRIAQEALTNVGKHARAKSVWIDLAFTARQVVLAIRDDGVGFVRATSTQSKRSYGLATMQERAQRIGAKLEIESPEDGGTSVRVCVQLAKAKKSIKPNIQS